MSEIIAAETTLKFLQDHPEIFEGRSHKHIIMNIENFIPRFQPPSEKHKFNKNEEKVKAYLRSIYSEYDSNTNLSILDKSEYVGKSVRKYAYIDFDGQTINDYTDVYWFKEIIQFKRKYYTVYYSIYSTLTYIFVEFNANGYLYVFDFRSGEAIRDIPFSIKNYYMETDLEFKYSKNKLNENDWFNNLEGDLEDLVIR